MEGHESTFLPYVYNIAHNLQPQGSGKAPYAESLLLA